MRPTSRIAATLAGSLALAGAAGYATAIAIAAGPPPPEKTVTVTIPHSGITGPTGPTGPAGSIDCPTGFVPGLVVINHPGGQVTIYACIQ
jgi:hypothetical protein